MRIHTKFTRNHLESFLEHLPVQPYPEKFFWVRENRPDPNLITHTKVNTPMENKCFVLTSNMRVGSNTFNASKIFNFLNF
jgi:hypothetical protein